MNIALDYDGTYTVDPELWDVLVATMKLRGHEVFIVTMRYEDKEAIERAPKGCLIYYTNRHAKRDYMQGHMRINIDIWIDDRPEFIIMSTGDYVELP